MTGVKKLVVVVAGALLCVAAASSIGSAQRGVSGTWRSETPSWWTGGWTVVLEARGTTLTGAVTNCPRAGAVEIFDGRVDGDTIRFSCRSEDGRSTISFTGNLAPATGWRVECDVRCWRPRQGESAGNPPVRLQRRVRIEPRRRQ